MQKNYFFCFQQSVCHTPVYLHLGYRFLLGQIQISNKAGGREMKEISVSCWGNLPLTVLSAVGIMSRALLRCALPAGSKILGMQRNWGEAGGMICTSMKPLPSSWQTRTWQMNWMGCVFSCHWKKAWSEFNSQLCPGESCCPAAIDGFHLQHVQSVLRMCGFCI